MGSGAGIAPAGTSPAGLFAPTTGTVPLSPALPDPLNLSSSLTGRFINFQTGDYQFSSDGRIEGMTTAQQMVLLALTTKLGSSAVPGLGQGFTSIQEQGADFVAQVTSAVNAALAPAVAANLVAVIGIDVNTLSTDDGAAIFVRWRDLTTGIEQRTPIG